MAAIDSHTRPAWRILLIGGCSGTGKTVTGRWLARRYAVSLLLIDDIRMAIQAVTTPEDQPALYTFIKEDSNALQAGRGATSLLQRKPAIRALP